MGKHNSTRVEREETAEMIIAIKKKARACLVTPRLSYYIYREGEGQINSGKRWDEQPPPPPPLPEKDTIRVFRVPFK